MAPARQDAPAHGTYTHLDILQGLQARRGAFPTSDVGIQEWTREAYAMALGGRDAKGAVDETARLVALQVAIALSYRALAQADALPTGFPELPEQ